MVSGELNAIGHCSLKEKDIMGKCRVGGGV